jgi:PAS domain S-box-containing protein
VVANPRIMIVEDEGLIALDLQAVLEDLGYEVPAVVASAEEALYQLTSTRPDLVLMDIRLNGAMDGVEAAAHIHRRFDIPLIYLTANSDEATFAQARTTLPGAYLLKPVKKRELRRSIELALARHQQTLETRQRLAAIVESSHDAIISVDLQGLISCWNQGAERIYGYPASAVQGRSLSVLVPPQRDGEIEQLLGLLQQGERVAQYETVRQRADGRLIHVCLTLSPLLDAQGQIVGASSIDRDVTAYKQAQEELEKAHLELEQRVGERTAQLQAAMQRLEREMAERQQAEQELVRLERLRALGELASGVSHNLNNLLVGILGPAEALQQATDPEEIREWSALILESGRRATELVRRLNRSVRNQSAEILQPVDVEAAVQEAVQATRHRWQDESASLGRRLELLIRVQDVPPVRATWSGLRDVLVNLLLNAVEAVPGNGTISIDARVQEGQVRLEVADNGIGMDEETRRRVFEPFFTTKADVGSGLGLATAYRLVTLWGGHIKVESAPAQGSCFAVYLLPWQEAAPE